MIFSKLKGGYWPNIDVLSTKAEKIVEAEQDGMDVTPFLAGSTPLKGGGFGASAKKPRHGGRVQGSNSPSPQRRNVKAQHLRESAEQIPKFTDGNEPIRQNY